MCGIIYLLVIYLLTSSCFYLHTQLNKLSGFYGIISLEYSDIIVVCIHVYSLLALGIFGVGLYGISKVKKKLFYAKNGNGSYSFYMCIGQV